MGAFITFDLRDKEVDKKLHRDVGEEEEASKRGEERQDHDGDGGGGSIRAARNKLSPSAFPHP